MKRLTVVIAAASMLAGAGLLSSVAVSQEGEQPGMGGMEGRQGMPNMQRQHGMQGMMGGGMMGGGMQACPMMSRSAAVGSPLIPQLPPGNEKLQVQMTAEIMQAAGQIASKYAAQVR